MKILLDTHALLWQLGSQDDEKLGVEARRLLTTAEVVYVSSISLVEIHIKAMLGKLDAPEGMQAHILAAGDEMLSYSATAADTLRGFPELARHDPFDRMLLAQAWAEGLLFMTTDSVLLGLGLNYVVDASK